MPSVSQSATLPRFAKLWFSLFALAAAALLLPATSSAQYKLGLTVMPEGAAAGSDSVIVYGGTGGWSASSSDTSWLNTSSNGTTPGGVVVFTFDANTGATSRTATLTIAGQTLTVEQAGTGYSKATLLYKLDSDTLLDGGNGAFGGIAADSSGNLFYPNNDAVDGITGGINEWNASTQTVTTNLVPPSGQLVADNPGYCLPNGADCGLTAAVPYYIDGGSTLEVYAESNSSTGNDLFSWTSASPASVTALANQNDFNSGGGLPQEMAIDSAGNPYMVDNYSPAIWVWKNSSLTYLTGDTNWEPNGTGNLSGLAIDLLNNIYVMDTTISDGSNQYGAIYKGALTAGLPTTLLVRTGSEGGNNAWDLAVDASGNLYIVNMTSPGAVWKYSAATQSFPGSPNFNFSTPLAISGTSKTLQGFAGVVVSGAGNYVFRSNGICFGGQNCSSGNYATGIFMLPNAYVDTATVNISGSAGSGSLPAVVPSTTILTGPFLPTSNQSWLTITAPSAGVVNFTVTANTGSPRTAQISVLGQSVSVTQATQVTVPPSITSASSTTFTVGSAGTFTVTATGEPTPSLSKTGALPSGVSFTDNGNGAATLAGTPAIGSGSSYQFSITANNGVGSPASQSFTLNVNGAATTTSASNANATYSANSQSVTLSASVSSVAGLVNSGTFTFTLLNGGVPVGSPTTSGTVANDSASVSYTLPAGTGAGTYTIQAVYNPGTGFNGSSDTSQVLTVGQATTTTAASNAIATYNAGAQSVTLAATVTSSSGTVNSGTVTFTVLNGGVPVGSATTSGTVAGGAASVSYTLPAGTGAGTYTLQAVYNGNGNLNGSSDSSHMLTLSPATTATAASSTVATYSASAQSVTLAATVNSSSGTVNSGTVTFTVLNGGVPVGSATTSGTVAGGAASVSYMLPAGTGAGTYTLQAVYNGNGNLNGSSDSSHMLTVNPPPSITSASSTTFIAGTPGSFSVTSSGGTGVLTLSVSNLQNAIPGLNIPAIGTGTLTIAGTPTGSGVCTFTITATDSLGGTATQNFTLTVDQAPSISSANNTTFTVGESGSFTVTSAAGTYPAATFSTTTTLPTGITLSSAGLLSGTPAAGTSGVYPFAITAGNGVGTPSTQNFTLTIVPDNILWLGNPGGTTSAFMTNGSPYLSTAESYGGTGVAIDSSGNVWSLNTSSYSVAEFTSAGAVTNNGFTGGGLSTPSALAIDGSNQVWIVNSTDSISVFNSSGTAISTTAYTGGGLSTPASVAIDISGNLWIANSGGNSVTKVLGAAAPTIPLATGVANSTPATKP